MRYGSDSIERGTYCLIDAREITQKIPDQLTTPSLESEIREHVQGCMLRFCDSRGFRGDSHAFRPRLAGKARGRAARDARAHVEPPSGSTAEILACAHIDLMASEPNGHEVDFIPARQNLKRTPTVVVISVVL